jgi:VanZ family protein
MNVASPIGNQLQLELRYSLFTLSAAVAIYVLSSIPDLGPAQRDPVLVLASNLSHTPTFGVLAFLLLKTISGTRQVSWEACGLALLGCALYAGVDEWHQSFVPGRHSSVGDFLLDLAGIGGMLLVLRLRASSTRAVVTASPRRAARS